MPATSLRGRFVWVELLTTEPAGAAEFYHNVLDWAPQAWQPAPDFPPYTMLNNGETPVGGIMQLPAEAAAAGAPPHWLPYIATTDADATLAEAVRLGATRLDGPFDVPEVGRVAVLADPLGAVFAIHQANTDPGAVPDEVAVGSVSWHELATDDQDRAFNFYQALFGWERIDAFDMGPAGTYNIFGSAGAPAGGIYDRPAEVPMSNWLVYVRVADLEATLERVGNHGGHVLNGPMDVPGGRVAQCLDPQGAAFALHVLAVQ